MWTKWQLNILLGWVGLGSFPFPLSSLPWLGGGTEEKGDALVIEMDNGSLQMPLVWVQCGPSEGCERDVLYLSFVCFFLVFFFVVCFLYLSYVVFFCFLVIFFWLLVSELYVIGQLCFFLLLVWMGKGNCMGNTLFIFHTKSTTMQSTGHVGICLLRRQGRGVGVKKGKNHCTKKITVFMHGGIYRKTQDLNSLVSGRNGTRRKGKRRYRWNGAINLLIVDFFFPFCFLFLKYFLLYICSLK